MSNGKYSIYLQDTNGLHSLYVAGHSTAVVTGATLTETLNDAGELTFTVPCSNPCYDLVSERVKVILYKGVDAIWYGYVSSYSKNARKDLKVNCLGELSYLSDSIQPQASYHNLTPKQLLKAYLDEHNKQSEEKFLLGRVTITDPNDSVYRYTNYETTLKALRDDLCDSLQGYLKVRHVGRHRYLDMLTISTYGTLCNQFIEFGKNLLDYTENVSATDIATACLPLGKKVEKQEVNGLDAYTTIKSVNSGKDYIANSTAVANYGTIKKVVKFNDVTVPSNLLTKANEWLMSNQYATMTLSLTAVDLSAINTYVTPKKWKDYAGDNWEVLGDDTWQDRTGQDWTIFNNIDWNVLDGVTFKDLVEATGNIDEFKVGDTVRCFALPYGMNTVFPIYSKTTNIQDPTGSRITLSYSAQKTFTKMVMGTESTSANVVTSEVGTIEVPTDASGNELYTYSTRNVYKNGVLATMNVTITGNIASGATIFTLPEGYRPTDNVAVSGAIYSSGSAVMSQNLFTIPTTGIVTAPIAITESAQINFTIVVG